MAGAGSSWLPRRRALVHEGVGRTNARIAARSPAFLNPTRMHRLVGRFTRWLAALAARHLRSPAAVASAAGVSEARTHAMLARIRGSEEDDELAPSYIREGGHVRLRGVEGPLAATFRSAHESTARVPDPPFLRRPAGQGEPAQRDPHGEQQH